jgi:hypothetical protein
MSEREQLLDRRRPRLQRRAVERPAARAQPGQQGQAEQHGALRRQREQRVRQALVQPAHGRGPGVGAVVDVQARGRGVRGIEHHQAFVGVERSAQHAREAVQAVAQAFPRAKQGAEIGERKRGCLEHAVMMRMRH